MARSSNPTTEFFLERIRGAAMVGDYQGISDNVRCLCLYFFFEGIAYSEFKRDDGPLVAFDLLWGAE